MTNERKQAMLEALFTDEASAKAAVKMTPEQVQAALKAKGEDYTIDEIKDVAKELNDMAEKLRTAADANGGELTPELLTQVSGGFEGIGGMIFDFVKTIFCGW